MITRRDIVIGTPAVLATGAALSQIAEAAENANAPNPPSLRLLAESDFGSSRSDRLTNMPAPEFGIDVSELRAGDVLRFYVSGTLQATHTVTSQEILSGQISLGLPALSDGAHMITATHSRGGAESIASNAENIAIDRSIAAPRISLAANSLGKGGDRQRTSKARISLTFSFAAPGVQAGDILYIRRDGRQILTWTLERGELSSLTVADPDTLTAGRTYIYDAYLERTAARRLSPLSTPCPVEIFQTTQTVTITPTATDLINSGMASYRHSVETGQASPDRITIAKFMSRASPPGMTFANVTLHVPDAASDPGGKPMTQIAVGANNTGSSYLVGIFALPNPNGTTAQIGVTYKGGAIRSFVQVEAMTGTGGVATPYDAKGGPWAVSSTVAVPSRGAVSVIAVVPNATSGSWNLARGEVDAPQGGIDSHTIAAAGDFPNGGNPTITLKHNAKISLPASAFASWGPE